MKKNIMKDFEEIIESRTISEEAKKLISKRVISNFAFGISFIILVLAYRVAALCIIKETAEIIYHISSLVFLLITIITFEVGYKKDDGKFAITGIELLVFSLFSLFAPYVFYIFDYKYITIILCVVTVYYIVKIIIIYNREQNKAYKENNDISVIIKKESQDKLAKKFGKVKNNEIKTVITSERPKKTQTKKSISKTTTSKAKSNTQPKVKKGTVTKATIVPKENVEGTENPNKDNAKEEISEESKQKTKKTTTRQSNTTKSSTTKKTPQGSKTSTTAKKTTTKKTTSKPKNNNGAKKTTTSKKKTTTKKENS